MIIMICQTCNGVGAMPIAPWYPCPDCNGCGITYCCDGHQAQPQAQSPTDAIMNLPESDIPQESCADAEDNYGQYWIVRVQQPSQ